MLAAAKKRAILPVISRDFELNLVESDSNRGFLCV